MYIKSTVVESVTFYMVLTVLNGLLCIVKVSVKVWGWAGINNGVGGELWET